MAKCRSWRPQTGTTHVSLSQRHLPGKCRECWGICGNRAEPGRDRCDDCEQLLAKHANPAIRRALLDEGKASEEILMYLSTDMDSGIADHARRQLAARALAMTGASHGRA